MVLLAITTIDPQGEVRNFSYHLPELEKGFDFLTSLVVMEYTLVNVHLVEDNKWTPLPTEAFDENLISPVIEKLEKEWQQTLSQYRV